MEIIIKFLQTAMTDPRTGLPYNFNIRNQLKPEINSLYKHFTLFNYLNHKVVLIIKFFKNEDNPYSQKCSNEIINNYLTTIQL